MMNDDLPYELTVVSKSSNKVLTKSEQIKLPFYFDLLNIITSAHNLLGLTSFTVMIEDYNCDGKNKTKIWFLSEN